MRATRTRYVPAGSLKVADRQSDAVAYIYTNKNNKPTMVVYYGKQSKAVAHFSYPTEAARERAVIGWFEARRQHDAAIAEYAAKRKAPRAVVATFEVGETYQDRSSCDWETIYSFKVIARTAKTITIEQHGRSRVRGVRIGEDGVEHCNPHGSYSMAAVIRADRKAA